VIGVVIVVGIGLVYLLGRSHGTEKVKKSLRDLFSDDRRKGRK
jgi:hypothetical protein